MSFVPEKIPESPRMVPENYGMYVPNFIVNNTKYQQSYCSFMTRIAYMYTSAALPSEEIQNSSTLINIMAVIDETSLISTEVKCIGLYPGLETHA